MDVKVTYKWEKITLIFRRVKMKKTKIFSIAMVTVFSTASLSTVAYATTNTLNTIHEKIITSSGPLVPGTEDIISHSTTWSRGVKTREGRVVDIKYDYYKLRGANGKSISKVYATYYDHNTGKFLESKLVQ